MHRIPVHDLMLINSRATDQFLWQTSQRLEQKTPPVVGHVRAYHHLVDGLLQPQADERGQGVVESQQHDGVDKIVPLTLRVNDKLPRVGTVALNDGREAEHPADTGGGGGGDQDAVEISHDDNQKIGAFSSHES